MLFRRQWFSAALGLFCAAVPLQYSESGACFLLLFWVFLCARGLFMFRGLRLLLFMCSLLHSFSLVLCVSLINRIKQDSRKAAVLVCILCFPKNFFSKRICVSNTFHLFFFFFLSYRVLLPPFVVCLSYARSHTHSQPSSPPTPPSLSLSALLLGWRQHKGRVSLQHSLSLSLYCLSHYFCFSSSFLFHRLLLNCINTVFLFKVFFFLLVCRWNLELRTGSYLELVPFFSQIKKALSSIIFTMFSSISGSETSASIPRAGWCGNMFRVMVEMSTGGFCYILFIPLYICGVI